MNGRTTVPHLYIQWAEFWDVCGSFFQDKQVHRDRKAFLLPQPGLISLEIVHFWTMAMKSAPDAAFSSISKEPGQQRNALSVLCHFLLIHI